MDQIISTEEAKEVSAADLFQKLASRENGLSDSEAEERLLEYGYGTVP